MNKKYLRILEWNIICESIFVTRKWPWRRKFIGIIKEKKNSVWKLNSCVDFKSYLEVLINLFFLPRKLPMKGQNENLTHRERRLCSGTAFLRWFRIVLWNPDKTSFLREITIHVEDQKCHSAFIIYWPNEPVFRNQFSYPSSGFDIEIWIGAFLPEFQNFWVLKDYLQDERRLSTTFYAQIRIRAKTNSGSFFFFSIHIRFTTFATYRFFSEGKWLLWKSDSKSKQKYFSCHFYCF